MKTMTCRELGGACDEKFQANTFEEIAKLSKEHAMEMFVKGDPAHLEAMEKMKELMKTPGALEKWMEERREEFDSLDED